MRNSTPPLSKTDAIYEDLLKKMADGALPVGLRLPTEKELAGEYGVAVLTLRKALKRLRAEGWIVSRRYHGTTVADPAAQDELKCKLNEGVIGIVMPLTAQAFFHPVFARLVNGVEGILSELGYALEAVVSNPTLKAQEEALLKKLRDPTIAGWLIPARLSDEAQELVRRDNRPKVALHSLNQSLSEHCFLLDHLALGLVILQHLQEQGYRRIAVIYPSAAAHWMERLAEVAASPAAPAPFEIHARLVANFSIDAGREAALALLEERQVDAFVCADDDLAVGVLDALRERGLSAPEIGVMGGGDFPIGTLTNPPLTTISHPYYQVGREAARLLVDLIEGKPVEVVTRRFAPRLVARESTLARKVSNENGHSSLLDDYSMLEKRDAFPRKTVNP